MPPINGILGIDVSEYRGYVNWYKVIEDDQQIVFAITKATDGTEDVDPTFDRNWAGMRRVGLVRGAFHYFRPMPDPEIQAEHFCNAMQGINRDFDFPLILDVERGKIDPKTGINQTKINWKKLDLEERKRRIRKCLERIEAISGRRPILYTNNATWDELFKQNEEFIDYPLWLAHYTDQQPTVPANNWGGKGYKIWQFTEDGVVAGVNNGKPPVDINIYPGTLSDMLVDFSMEQAPDHQQIAEYLNSDILEAAKLCAQQFGEDFEGLLLGAQLSHLHTDEFNHGRPYGGPPIDQLPGLNAQMCAAMKNALEDVDHSPTNLGKPGLSNQNVINIFIDAGKRLGVNGLSWISRAKLSYLYDVRQETYNGPMIDELPGLNPEERQALKREIEIE